MTSPFRASDDGFIFFSAGVETLPRASASINPSEFAARGPTAIGPHFSGIYGAPGLTNTADTSPNIACYGSLLMHRDELLREHADKTVKNANKKLQAAKEKLLREKLLRSEVEQMKLRKKEQQEEGARSILLNFLIYTVLIACLVAMLAYVDMRNGAMLGRNGDRYPHSSVDLMPAASGNGISEPLVAAGASLRGSISALIGPESVADNGGAEATAGCPAQKHEEGSSKDGGNDKPERACNTSKRATSEAKEPSSEPTKKENEPEAKPLYMACYSWCGSWFVQDENGEYAISQRFMVFIILGISSCAVVVALGYGLGKSCLCGGCDNEEGEVAA